VDADADADGIGDNNDNNNEDDADDATAAAATTTTNTMDLVDAVLFKDELSRKHLQNLQDHKKCLKQLQLRLRPTKNKTPQPVVGKKKKKKDTENEDSNSNSETTTLPNTAQKRQQESLAPSSSTSSSATEREDLMKEKKDIETRIKLAEADWKASLQDTHKTLCKLASPVTTIMTKANGDERGGGGDIITAAFHDPDAIQVVAPPPLLVPNNAGGCPNRSSLGMDLEQAWRQYTLRHFAAYLWVELPGGVSVVESSSDNASSRLPSLSPLHAPCINRDRAHELWGPIGRDSSSTNTPVAMLPSWIRLLTESLPNKSIWGEKELPRYTAIWSSPKEKYSKGESGDQQDDDDDDDDWFGVLPGVSSSSIHGPFSLELVAIAAPSVVDAREIQNNLVEELLNYYSGLLGDVREDEPQSRNKKALLKRVIVSPPDLHTHEWSRIEIHCQLPSSSSPFNFCNAKEEKNSVTESRTNDNNVNNNNSINTLRLGWVSHWGDAATRACDMSFAGGGVVRGGGKNKYSNKSARNASTKEYVHLVEASVIDNSSSMWSKILYANSNAPLFSTDDADSSRRKEKQALVDVPQVLVPYLIRPIPKNSLSVPLEDLFLDEKSKKKKKETVFGVRPDIKDTSVHRDEQREPAIIPCNNSRMGMSEMDSACAKDQPRFPPFAANSTMSQEELQKRIRMEKLSCPYDFLFE
jgi:hypothetical protein